MDPSAPASATEAASSPAVVVALPAGRVEGPVRGHCGKCGKPFLRAGKFLVAHEERCDGTPYDPSKAPKPQKRSTADPSPADPASPLDATLQECERAKARVTLEIAITKKQLESLAKQEASIDAILAKIREAKEP